MIGELFSIIAPVFICAGIGMAWERQGRPYDTEFVTTLTTNVGVPCLVFSTLADVDLDPQAFAVMAVAALAALASFAAVSTAVLGLARLPLRAFLPSMIFPNSGNMALPLSLLAFGEPGLALSIAYFAVYVVAQFVLTPVIAAGTMSLVALARMPILYAVAVAVLFMVAGAKPPAWIANTTRILGGMTIPLMLITLGISLAKLKVGSLGRSAALAVLRLVMGFTVGVALAETFGMSGAARGVLILQAAMPVAVFNYLFAQRYNQEPEEVAGIVVISTAVSFATLPVLLWYLL